MKTFCLITIVILLCRLTTFAQNPAEVMTHRGYTTEANLNTATSNGFYGVNRPGMDMSSLLTFNAFGSTGPVQMKFTYWGDFSYRNQIDSDSSRWTKWKYVCSGIGSANQLTKFTGSSSIASSVIYDDGTNVGIGTNNPLTNLQVGNVGNGTIKKIWVPGKYNFEGGYLSNNNSTGAKLELVSNASLSTSSAWSLGNEDHTLNGALVISNATPTSNYSTLTYTEAMRITTSGNLLIATTTDNKVDKLQVNGNIYTNSKILIGTSGLNSGSHSLAVNGSAIFTKVVVKLNNVWPDYVFKHNYKLRPLNELESFLIKYQHLPDMPSSTEVEKNGLDLGEHQSLLLKKVEELTLYVIELNKKIVALSLENAELKKK